MSHLSTKFAQVNIIIIIILIIYNHTRISFAVRQFGGQNFGNGLGQGVGGIIGGAGFGPGAGGNGGPGLGSSFGYPAPGGAQGCPLCDSSVYSYCSHKMVHDACCCDFQGKTINSTAIKIICNPLNLHGID